MNQNYKTLKHAQETLVLYKRITKSNNAHSAYKAQRTTKLKRHTQQIEAIMPKGARAQCVTTARAGRTIDIHNLTVSIHNHTITQCRIPNSNHKAYITITIPIRVLIYQSLTSLPPTPAPKAFGDIRIGERGHRR